MGTGEKPVLTVANNTMSTSVTVTVGDNEKDQQIVDDLQTNTSVEDIVIATEPPTEHPTEPPTFPSFPCGEGQVDVYIRRSFNRYAEEESFSLFEGPYGLDGDVYNSTFIDSTHTIEQLCLSAMCHTLVMEDSYGDGWFDGSSVSFILNNGTEVYEYTMRGGYKQSEVIYLGGECPTTPPPTLPPTTPPPTTPVPTTPAPTEKPIQCVNYTIERTYTTYAVEESLTIYLGSLDSEPLWSLSNEITSKAYSICLPEGTIFIKMNDKYVCENNSCQEWFVFYI